MIIEKSDTNLIAMGLSSKLLQHRIISISDNICPEIANEVNNAIKYLITLNKEPITLQINSSGGECYSGFAIIDTIELAKKDGVPVNIIVEGMAASMAAAILLVGSKRYATKRSVIMLHQVSGGYYDKNSSLQIQAKEVDRVNNELKKLIGEYSDMEPIHESILEDLYLTPEEALKLGIIDGIL